ncbi:hypothetical protein JCM3770_004941 [Rhodotorula araucariae]
MVRSRAAGPAPFAAPSDYFDSLAELAAYAAAPRPPRSRFEAPLVPLAQSRPTVGADHGKGRRRMLVCHDYKGGYSERDDERGYTFAWWHLIDTFVYFSHHRVSCPPAGWIRAAHHSGTKILGTLIFEHDAGRADVAELVAPTGCRAPGDSDSEPFARLSTRYADWLVDLALERGFDGWLVNVEVPLGGAGGLEHDGRAHARALVAWLRYFSQEMRRRVPGGEIMWYDAVTTDGTLVWQNAVTDSNFPFFDACDSIFLNYWWRHDQLDSTTALLDRLDRSRCHDVYFGIDIYGRGTFAGGGFESWRAAHTIEQAQASSGFSTALFAPGWTVEAESLAHSLDLRESFARWKADDDYLFTRLAPTPSVVPELARHDRERREQRGVLRARQLAALCAPAASPLPLYERVPSPPTFAYDAPLAPPPGAELGLAHKPLAAFRSAPRATPAPTSRFATSFAGGSGHAFFVAGGQVLDEPWTDVAFTGAYPALAMHPPGRAGIAAELVEHDAWEGPRALRLRVERAGHDGLATVGAVVQQDGESGPSATVPLCAVDLPTFDLGVRLVVDVVWKEDGASAVPATGPVAITPLLSPGTTDACTLTPHGSVAVDELTNGWTRSRATFPIAAETPSCVWHLAVAVPLGCAVLIGSLNLYPAPAPTTPAFLLSPPHYDPSSLSMRWELDLQPAAHDMHAPLGRSPTPSLALPLYYHLFHRSPSAQIYLGTTSAREFSLNLARLGGRGEVVVKAVFADGTVHEASTPVEALPPPS